MKIKILKEIKYERGEMQCPAEAYHLVMEEKTKNILCCFRDNALFLLSVARRMMKLDVKRRDFPRRDFSKSIIDSDNHHGIDETRGVIKSIACESFRQSKLHLKITSNLKIINTAFYQNP